MSRYVVVFEVDEESLDANGLDFLTELKWLIGSGIIHKNVFPLDDALTNMK